MRQQARLIAIAVLLVTSPVWLPFLFGVAIQLYPYGLTVKPENATVLRERDARIQNALHHWWQFGLTRNQTYDAAANLVSLSYNMGLILGVILLGMIVVCVLVTGCHDGAKRVSARFYARSPDQYWGKQAIV